MLHLLWEVIWCKWRKYASACIAIVTFYSWVAEVFYPDVGILTMQDLLPFWEWWAWAMVGLGLLWFATFALLDQKTRLLQSHDNWIVAYKARHGKLPSVPKSLLPLVDNYADGKPISKKIRLKTDSRYWHGLIDDNREKFLQLADWLGEDRHDYLQHMRDTAPPGGSSITHLHRKDEWFK